MEAAPETTKRRDLGRRARLLFPWESGVLTSRSVNGGPSVRTTAQMAMRGTTLLMIRRVPVLIIGAKTGLAGISDDRQLLCFVLALWNGKDPIIKECLFGLSNGERNHGEDVKEYYLYLDSTPPHSYMKCLSKYPQAAYPYSDLVETNRKGSRDEFEYELLDTGILNEDRYFDVYVEYAKASPEDMLIRISVCNRGPEIANLHMLPTLCLRNTWAWRPSLPKPLLGKVKGSPGTQVVSASHGELGTHWLYIEADVPRLFTENETNNARIFGTANATPYVKDAIKEFLAHARTGAVNSELTGTKAASHHKMSIQARESAILRLRLSYIDPQTSSEPFRDFDQIFEARLAETDEFSTTVIPANLDADQANVMR
jgi:hypothetical protein